MRIATVLLQGAALFDCAFAGDAYLWTIDHGTVKGATSQSSAVNAKTAGDIIARRRGITEDRFLRVSDEDTLSEINHYGGFQQPLFHADEDKIPGRLFIRISGYNGGLSQFATLPDLWVENASQDLQDDFGARAQAQDICEYNLSISTKSGIDIVYSYSSQGLPCLSTREVEKLPALITVYTAAPTAENVTKDLVALLRMLSHLSMTEDIESTVLVLPPLSELRKSNTRRSAQSEEPLDLPTSGFPEFADDAATTFQSNSSNSTEPLPKFVSRCFTSEGACNNATNSCSGRGSCYKAYSNCFQCKCGTSVVREGKTIQWGGNACQKKDISMPFALFAFFGVFMTAVVVGGIGMIYSMGAQELPSVLGAGVGGPRAQK